MEDSLISILMLVLGISLMMAEVFVPSGGLLSLFSLGLIAASYYFAWQAWYDTTPSVFWGFIVISLILTPGSIVGAFYVLPKTPFGKKVLLEAPDIAEVTPFSREKEYLTELVGMSGTTVSLLNPGGLVAVGGERLHCESEGQIIDPGVQVVITGHRGNSVVVREIGSDSFPESGGDAADRSGQKLDFDEMDG